MLVKMILGSAFVALGLGAAWSAASVFTNCCDRGEACCAVGEPCCTALAGKTGSPVDAASAYDSATSHDDGSPIAKPNCCAKRAYCCVTRAACCRGGATPSDTVSPATNLAKNSAANGSSCCKADGACCESGRDCCADGAPCCELGLPCCASRVCCDTAASAG